MNKSQLFLIMTGLVFILVAPKNSETKQTSNEKLEVGFSKGDATPKIGNKPVYIAGFGHNRKAEGVSDPIFIRAMVLKTEGKKYAFVSADLIGLFKEQVDDIRKELKDFENVMFSCTHSHEGPDTLGLWGQTPFQSGTDPDYLLYLQKIAVSTIREAAKNLTECDTEIAAISIPELLHDGRPPIVKMDELLSLKFNNTNTKTALGIVLFWHCHPETLGSGNKKLSSDFVGYTVKEIMKQTQAEAIVFTGAVGGLMTSLKVSIKNDQGQNLNDGTYEKTERYGQLLANASLNSLRKAKAINLTPIVVRKKEILLPVDNPIYRLAKQMGVFKREIIDWDLQLNKHASLNQREEKHPAAKTEVSVISLGELGIGCIPGEIYPELLLGKVATKPEKEADYQDAPTEYDWFQKWKMPYKTVIGLANDEIGYILPKKQWDEKPPFAYGSKSAPYGEINSLGPDTAFLIANAFKELLFE
ncbi:MAG: hypothetical protein EBT92_03095 [Planctomycetes bacterium]|nr:hypothetical protein [Planctomycetota bacterium]NBY03724.1 hypothetical protein [Planctomycetota bacterium]